MPQFVVPQFIDVEDKIIGPITTRQFIMGVITMLIMFLAYRLADLSLFIVEAVILFVLYIVVAFVKVNGQPSYYFFLSIIRAFKRPSLRIWDKSMAHFDIAPARGSVAKEEDGPHENVAPRKVLAQQELSSLALMVDTGGRYRPEEILARHKQKNIT